MAAYMHILPIILAPSSSGTSYVLLQGVVNGHIWHATWRACKELVEPSSSSFNITLKAMTRLPRHLALANEVYSTPSLRASYVDLIAVA